MNNPSELPIKVGAFVRLRSLSFKALEHSPGSHCDYSEAAFEVQQRYVGKVGMVTRINLPACVAMVEFANGQVIPALLDPDIVLTDEPMTPAHMLGGQLNISPPPSVSTDGRLTAQEQAFADKLFIRHFDPLSKPERQSFMLERCIQAALLRTAFYQKAWKRD